MVYERAQQADWDRNEDEPDSHDVVHAHQDDCGEEQDGRYYVERDVQDFAPAVGP
jgi:hypothetical protein